MALTADVVNGSMAQSTWANEIRDRTIQVFATFAELSTWAAPDGSFAAVTASRMLYERVSGSWLAYKVGGLAVPIQELSTSSSTYSNDATTDMALNNVPVVAGHTYGIHLHTLLNWASLNDQARWDGYIRINGVDHRRIFVHQPVVTGVSYWTIDATVFWKPTVTASTDDISLRVVEVNDGANLTLSGGSVLTRTLALYDLGIP